MFTYADGRPIRPEYLSHRFHVLVKELDLPPIRLHDLRHGAATIALTSRTDLKVIQQMLGHSGSSKPLTQGIWVARDFADIYILARASARTYCSPAQIDAGFDVRVLADMIATLDRFTDSEIPVPDGSSAAELRAFYADWRSELAA
jgi:integrase